MLRAYMEAARIFQIEKALRFGTVQISKATLPAMKKTCPSFPRLWFASVAPPHDTEELSCSGTQSFNGFLRIGHRHLSALTSAHIHLRLALELAARIVTVLWLRYTWRGMARHLHLLTSPAFTTGNVRS